MNAKQIKIVATGYYPDVTDYLFSEDWQRDFPGFIIDRDGEVHGGQGDNNVIALENARRVVLRDGCWWPAAPDQDGRFVPIEGADPVRCGYEICDCGKAYEMIGDKQLKTLRRLLKSLLSQFSLTFPYDNQLGAICPRAIAGGTGIYFASSYDKRRDDIHPQVELILLIKSLAS